MKTFNKTLIAATTIATFGLAAAPAALSLEASAGLSTSYLFRGAEERDGTAVVYADVSSSTAGVSYGLFISSGDTETEHDYYVSYAGSASDISYEIGYVDYNYQNQSDDPAPDSTDFRESYVSLGYGPVSVTRYNGIGNDDEYTVVGYEAGAFSVAYGENNAAGMPESHMDVSYAVNDSLSITVSDPDDGDTVFAASYSLPF